MPNQPVSETTNLRTLAITVENLAPPRGTVLTPLWFGFHDGSFTIYSLGSPASHALERLAEDGNTGPLTNEFSRRGAGVVQGTLFGSDDVLNSIFPGSVVTQKILLDTSRCKNLYLSYGAMVVPSNDAFIANENPLAHQIVDGDGNFLGADVTVFGTEVRDAGTEVNDEAPFHAAGAGPIFLFDAGVAENGVVHTHKGYKAGGTILSNPAFANANFKVGGYRVARIVVTKG